jgi:hypothetical protein
VSRRRGERQPRWWETAGPRSPLVPEFRLVQGDLLLELPGREDAAEVQYRRAFDKAGAWDQRMPELRAAIRLCRLSGERDAAFAELRTVDDTFTEGLDTPDLTEARELIGRPS